MLFNTSNATTVFPHDFLIIVSMFSFNIFYLTTVIVRKLHVTHIYINLNDPSLHTIEHVFIHVYQ